MVLCGCKFRAGTGSGGRRKSDGGRHQSGGKGFVLEGWSAPRGIMNTIRWTTETLNNFMHGSDKIKFIFQNVYSGCTFENGFKGSKTGSRVNLEDTVVDEEDNGDADSRAYTVPVIVVHYVLQLSSDL